MLKTGTVPTSPGHCIIVNDDQQDATILAYLFIPNQFYMFRAMSSPIMDEMELTFHLIHDNSRQQYRWTISDAVHSQVLLMMGEDIDRNM